MKLEKTVNPLFNGEYDKVMDSITRLNAPYSSVFQAFF